MMKIFNLHSKYEIVIDENCIRRDDDYISFAFPNGFNWHHHAQTCLDCNAFLNSFGKLSDVWLLELDNELFILNLKDFGKKEDYFKNFSQFRISSNFNGTEMRFKKNIAELSNLEKELMIKVKNENYEGCAQIRDIMGYIKTQRNNCP